MFCVTLAHRAFLQSNQTIIVLIVSYSATMMHWGDCVAGGEHNEMSALSTKKPYPTLAYKELSLQWTLVLLWPRGLEDEHQFSSRHWCLEQQG